MGTRLSIKVIIGMLAVYCLSLALYGSGCKGQANGEVPRREYQKINDMIVSALQEAHREEDKIKGRQKLVTAVEEIIQKYPNSEAIPRAYYMLAACYEKPGEEEKRLDYVKKGLAAYEKLVEKIGNKSVDGFIYYFGGCFYEALGNKDKSLSAHRRLVDGDYDEITKAGPRIAMCYLYVEKGALTEAKQQYEKLSPRFQRRIYHRFPKAGFPEPTNGQGKTKGAKVTVKSFNAIRELVENGRYEEAVAKYDETIQRKTVDRYTFWSLEAKQRAFERMGKPAKVKQASREAIRFCKEFMTESQDEELRALAHWTLAESYWFQGRIGNTEETEEGKKFLYQAIAEWKQIIRDYGHLEKYEDSAWRDIAQTYELMKDWEKAAEAYQKCGEDERSRQVLERARGR